MLSSWFFCALFETKNKTLRSIVVQKLQLNLESRVRYIVAHSVTRCPIWKVMWIGGRDYTSFASWRTSDAEGGRLDRGRGGVMDMHRAHLVSNASFVVAMLPALMADRTTLRVVWVLMQELEQLAAYCEALRCTLPDRLWICTALWSVFDHSLAIKMVMMMILIVMASMGFGLPTMNHDINISVVSIGLDIPPCSNFSVRRSWLVSLVSREQGPFSQSQQYQQSYQHHNCLFAVKCASEVPSVALRVEEGADSVSS